MTEEERYARAWTDLKWRRLTTWGLAIVGLAIMYAVPVTSLSTFLLRYGFLLLTLIACFHWVYFRCPKCSGLFYGTKKFGRNPFAVYCASCGAQRGKVPDANAADD